MSVISGCPWSICEFVLVPYVNVVIAVTVMHVLLFVLNVCMVRGCVGNSNAAMTLTTAMTITTSTTITTATTITTSMVITTDDTAITTAVYGWYTWFRCCVSC